MERLRFVGARVPAEGLSCSEGRVVRPDFERAVAYGLYEQVHGVARPLGSKLTGARAQPEMVAMWNDC
jgi:hypothetical protein